MSVRSRQHPQNFAQITRITNLPFDLRMGVFPDWIRLCQQRSAGRRQSKTPAPAVLLIDRNLQQPAPFKRLEIGRKRRPVHREKGRDVAQRRRLGTIERHQQRKLTVGEVERPQHIVKAARQCACRAMDVQAQAVVAHQVSGGERELIIFCVGV